MIAVDHAGYRRRSTPSTNQQQPGLAGKRFRGAMDARQNGASGILDCYPPEIPDTERIRLRSWEQGVVEIVTVLIQEFLKLLVILPSEKLEKPGARLGNIDMPPHLIIAHPLAREPMIGTEVSVRFHRGTVRMEGEDICGDDLELFISRITVDAVEDRVETACAEKLLILEEDLDGFLSFRTHRQAPEQCIIESIDPLPCAEMLQYLTKIARQGTPPAEGVDISFEAGGDKLFKAVHHLDARMAGGESKG